MLNVCNFLLRMQYNVRDAPAQTQTVLDLFMIYDKSSTSVHLYMCVCVYMGICVCVCVLGGGVRGCVCTWVSVWGGGGGGQGGTHGFVFLWHGLNISVVSFSVYLYGEAAVDEKRKALPSIRAGEFEGLPEKVTVCWTRQGYLFMVVHLSCKK